LKQPGTGLQLAEQRIGLELKDIPDADPLPPYVALLHDVTIGDRSLFTSSAGLAQAWRVVAPLLQHPPEIQPYAAGSTGPAVGDALPGVMGWLS